MLARVAVIALGAVLISLTVALFIQVGSGPRLEGEVRAALPSGGDDGGDGGDDDDERRRGRSAQDEARAERRAAREDDGASDPARAAAAGGSKPSVAVASNLRFDEANKLYDRREYEEARALALSLLFEYPSSVRMRRVVIASSCIMGDHELAQQHYVMLPAESRDRADMRERCIPYGASFAE